MGIKIEMFPQELIDLNEEISHPVHWELQQNLARHTTEEGGLPEKIGEVAAYCGIVLDGIYTPNDILALAEVMTHKLRDKRAIVISSLS